MESRGGIIDPLQARPGTRRAPVALISAVHGTGLDAVPLFLHRTTRHQGRAASRSRSVLGNAASTHPGPRRSAAAPAIALRSPPRPAARLDNVLPPSHLGTAALSRRRHRRLSRWSSPSDSPSATASGDSSHPGVRWHARFLPAGWLQSLVLDGAWKGVPPCSSSCRRILLLFLFIGVLEDSGYLARAALIADRVMRTIGLNGKAFHPAALRVCLRRPRHHGHAHHREQARPPRHHSRNALHDCSARLPVYMLIIAAFIPNIAFLPDSSACAPSSCSASTSPDSSPP